MALTPLPTMGNNMSTSISGSLSVYLHQKDTSNVLACFELKQLETDRQAEKTLAKPACFPLDQPTIHFVLHFPARDIQPQKRYSLVTKVVQGGKDKQILAEMSVPVLTQGNPSEVNLAISVPPEPVE